MRLTKIFVSVAVLFAGVMWLMNLKPQPSPTQSREVTDVLIPFVDSDKIQHQGLPKTKNPDGGFCVMYMWEGPDGQMHNIGREQVYDVDPATATEVEVKAAIGTATNNIIAKHNQSVLQKFGSFTPAQFGQAYAQIQCAPDSCGGGCGNYSAPGHWLSGPFSSCVFCSCPRECTVSYFCCSGGCPVCNAAC
jgi:hypothetical protein